MSTSFPVLRWVALAYLVVWLPAYAMVWGPANFLNFCNVAVILTCAGLWLGSPLLLSSQFLATAVIGTLWFVDLLWTAATHGHALIGGTEYMWDARYPLWVRLLSLDHVVVPAVALWGIHKLGYARRAMPFQSVLAAVIFICSRLVAPELNLNFAQKELVTYHSWGPAPVHLLLIWAVLVLLLYWPVHALLCRAMPAPCR